MITGGFGMTMDLARGTTRHWVMGRDGVKRWADTNEPVSINEPETQAPTAGGSITTGIDVSRDRLSVTISEPPEQDLAKP